jgi:peptidoglycan/xylan/chitin deacetylase (PgdA/CDA1 family)
MNQQLIIANLIIRSGLLSVIERLEAKRANVLRILAYHRLGRPETENGLLDPGLINSTPEMFAQQMRFLKEHYHVLSLDELLCAMAEDKPLPPRSVMITYDDNYREFLDTAWPVLSSLQLPAILFLATDYLNQNRRLFWWDRLYQAFSQTKHEELHLPAVGDWPLRTPQERMTALAEIKKLVRATKHQPAMSLVEQTLDILAVSPQADGLMLTWQDVHYLSSHGLYIGAHTRSHPVLSRLTVKEAMQEIIGSQLDLSHELNQTWPVFAYTFGNQAALHLELRSLLQKEGFQVAMTLIEGHNYVGRTNPLWFKRLGMASHLSMNEFRLALTGLYNIYGTMLNLRATNPISRLVRLSRLVT